MSLGELADIFVQPLKFFIDNAGLFLWYSIFAIIFMLITPVLRAFKFFRNGFFYIFAPVIYSFGYMGILYLKTINTSLNDEDANRMICKIILCILLYPFFMIYMQYEKNCLPPMINTHIKLVNGRPRQIHAFVSHSSKDNIQCKKIVSVLRTNNIGCWIDLDSIRGGEDFELRIQSGLNAAKIFVIALSENSISSEWCQRELLIAKEKNLVILPIVIDKKLYQKGRLILNDFFEKELSHIQCIDCTTRYSKSMIPVVQRFKELFSYDSYIPEKPVTHNVTPYYILQIAAILIPLFILPYIYSNSSFFDNYDSESDSSQVLDESKSSDASTYWSDYIEFTEDDFFIVDNQIFGLSYDELEEKLGEELEELEDVSEMGEDMTQSVIEFKGGTALYFVFDNNKLDMVSYVIYNDYSFNSIRNAANKMYGEYSENDGFFEWNIEDYSYYLFEGKQEDDGDYGLIQVYMPN